MKRTEIENTLKSLAHSQGFYSRVWDDIQSLPTEERNEFYANLEQKNFKDLVDLIMYFEC